MAPHDCFCRQLVLLSLCWCTASGLMLAVARADETSVLADTSIIASPQKADLNLPYGRLSPAVELPGDSLGRPADTWWPGRALSRLRHRDPDDPGRHVGLGRPLAGTSWRNRPYHVGWLAGGLFGEPLIDGRIDQDEDLLGGYRVGWDFDHYWGSEVRFVFANLDLTYPLGGPGRPTSRDRFLDLHLVYYPWGDARWRPFLSVGIGAADFYFPDEQRRNVHQTAFSLPWGGGVKYYWKHWLALRLSVMDNWSLSAGPLDAMHNLSVTGGAELHFGGPRRSYFPYHAGLRLW